MNSSFPIRWEAWESKEAYGESLELVGLKKYFIEVLSHQNFIEQSYK